MLVIHDTEDKEVPVECAYNIRKKPFVAKTVDGAGSSGVFLINNNRDLKKVREKISFSRYLKMLKKYIWYFLKFSEILMYQTFLYENIDLKVLYIIFSICKYMRL